MRNERSKVQYVSNNVDKNCQEFPLRDIEVDFKNNPKTSLYSGGPVGPVVSGGYWV